MKGILKYVLYAAFSMVIFRILMPYAVRRASPMILVFVARKALSQLIKTSVRKKREKTSAMPSNPKENVSDVFGEHVGKEVLTTIAGHPLVLNAAAKLDSVIEDPEGALQDLVEAHPKVRRLIGSAAKFIERANKPGGTAHE